MLREFVRSRHSPSVPIVIAIAAAAILVLARSAVFLIWQDADFDSDQAIFGLMAKHLSELRAFPMFLYGERYLMAVEAWITAPVFVVFGPSVTALKLPLVAINVATAGLLVWVLHRDAGLRPWAALLAAAFVVAAPPSLAALLTQAGGANPEPYLYVLLLWVLRGRPLLFGMMFGFGFLHREFTAYGATAIVALALLDNPRLTSERLRAVALAGVGYLIVWQLAQIGILYSTPLGPGSTIAQTVGTSANVEGLLARVCLDGSRIAPALLTLFRDFFAVPFGVDDHQLGQFGINSLRRTGVEGWPSMWPLLRFMFVVALARVAWLSIRRRTPIWRGHAAFGTFLLLVGLQSAVVYAIARCGELHVVTFRYALLSVFAGVGVLTLFYVYERSPAWISAVSLVVALWCLASATAHVRLVGEYLDQPPVNSRSQLANYLVAHGVRYARSDYWTAYYTTFLAGERVVIASTDVVRVASYERLAMEHPKMVVRLMSEPCSPPGGQEIIPGQYWMCPD